MFSPFPKIPEVNLTEVERLLALAKVQTIAVGGMYAQTSCYWKKINETYSLVVQQLEERVNLVKKGDERIGQGPKWPLRDNEVFLATDL